MRAALHPPVSLTPARRELLVSRSAQIAGARGRPKPMSARGAPAVSVPLTTVTTANGFDAYVNISFRGAGGAWMGPLLVDSGNNSLIFPDYAAIAALPGFAQNYSVIEYDIAEPWGAPACKLRGPIRLPAGGDAFEIADCVFYACTGVTPAGERTANFGTGCLARRTLGTTDLQSPLAIVPDFPCAELDYTAAVEIEVPGAGPIITGNSFLNLYAAAPDDYQVFDIIPGQKWMALRPKALTIGGKDTGWPGDLAASSLALIDTGGGPVFLSDPENLIWPLAWPSAAVLPGWVGGSYCCQATSAPLAITLADAAGKEFTYTVDTAKLPPLVQGLTLVACQTCSFMGRQPDGAPQNGMNVGGISALFNDILVDYATARVGFKAKAPPAA
jgi:hypothetical protein